MPRLDATLDHAFRLLRAAGQDPAAPFRTVTLATIAGDGAPSLRSVILRAADPSARCLAIHTDRRSAKLGQLAADPRAALHGYDPGERIQLRLAGTLRAHLGDAAAEAAWAASPEPSRRIYATPLPPGTPIGSPAAGPAESAPGRDNFALLAFAFHRLEWLRLAPSGHQRARFDWDEAGTLTATWLAP